MRVKAERIGRVLVVRMDRVDKRNAVDAAMTAELSAALDLVGHGRFSVVTGIGGQAWLDAAATLGSRLGLTVTRVSIGPGEEFEDPYGTWAGLREIEDGGVLLVRPDLYVGARHLAAPGSTQEAHDWLGAALDAVLGRGRSPGVSVTGSPYV